MSTTVILVLVLVVALIVVFGTARAPWARGLALLLMGGAVIVAPPRVKLRTVPTLMLLMLALASITSGRLLALAPARRGRTPWRHS